MANKNSKRRSKLARKGRAQLRWARVLDAKNDGRERFKNTIRGK